MERPLAAARWLVAAESRRLLDLLTAGGLEARFIGGCVRDTLLDPGLDEVDLDLVTPLLPEDVMRRLVAAGVRVAPTGLDHGTVTARIGARVFEITTLRHDVETDGRHALVAFTTDFMADVLRRDLTINTMATDGDGRLFDPLGGRDDLARGLVRFVGDPVQRIREDYLRILRYFRFMARFGHGAVDRASADACAAEQAGLGRLAVERVWKELKGLLAAARPLAPLALMAATGILARVLPAPADREALARLLALDAEPDPLLRLAALLRRDDGDPAPAERTAAALKLSLAEARLLLALTTLPLPPLAADTGERLAAIDRLDLPTYRRLATLSAAAAGLDPAAHAALQADLARLPQPRFPLTGADLLARGIPPGPAFGRLLASLRDGWREGGCVADRAACLAELERRIAEPP